MQANDDSVDARVRRRLRELRTERGLTLEQVGGRANIDVSTLSRLESGKRRLALDHIAPLAAALGVSSDELLAVQPPQDPRVREPPRKSKGVTYWPLTRRGPAGGLHTFKLVIDPKRREPPAELPVHEGHDWLFVLSGRLRLLLGEEDLVIEPGEAVEFSTWTPHWFGVVEEAVELIAVFGQQGERIHLH